MAVRGDTWKTCKCRAVGGDDCSVPGPGGRGDDENVGASGEARSVDCEKKLGMFDGNSGVVGDDRQ
jgi:hypothetical protein